MCPMCDGCVTNVTDVIDVTDCDRCHRLGPQGFVKLDKLLLGLSALCRGDEAEKLRYTLKAYDRDGDDCLSAAELSRLLTKAYTRCGRRQLPHVDMQRCALPAHPVSMPRRRHHLAPWLLKRRVAWVRVCARARACRRCCSCPLGTSAAPSPMVTPCATSPQVRAAAPRGDVERRGQGRWQAYHAAVCLPRPHRACVTPVGAAGGRRGSRGVRAQGRRRPPRDGACEHCGA